jgi:hypothetical protein
MTCFCAAETDYLFTFGKRCGTEALRRTETYLQDQAY